ncbi:MAG: hypothetical protein A3J38_03750 [Gammaproteobacteria bacterium RIFCSPHIGHO2_12_FULL_45_9]|nr:MAG: hypothetical protein A3J38_03750 [Gammaproteobacteria bacterium RIFCSPHIGHO2_12_FULL_45_9]
MSAVATKADLIILKLEMQNDIQSAVSAVQLDLHREMSTMKSELQHDLSSHLHWIVSLLVGFCTAMLGVMAKGFHWI